MTKVSLIIPAHNEETNIRKVIESCRLQSHEDLEVLIVESQSKDDTLKIAKEACHKIRDFKVLALKKGDYALARNEGAQKAAGEILLFLDADCEPPIRFLDEVVQLVNQGTVLGKGQLTPNNSKWRAKFVCAVLNKLPQRGCSATFVTRDFFESVKPSFKSGIMFPDEEWMGRAIEQLKKTKGTFSFTRQRVKTDMRRFESKGYLTWLQKWLSTDPAAPAILKSVSKENEFNDAPKSGGVIDTKRLRK